jgi:hypothetical protein
MGKVYTFSVSVNIDFDLLNKQKVNILKLITDLDRKRVADQDCKKFINSLDGIVSILDSIQDQAVDQLEISEKEVFPSLYRGR